MRLDSVSSVFWLSFGASVIYFSRKLGLGTVHHIGPGFLAFWSAILICCASLAILVISRKRVRGDEQKKKYIWAGLHWRKTIVVATVLFVYVLAFPRIGFIISTTFFLFILLRAIDPVKWWVAVLVSILASFLSFSFFDLWLQVQLPHWLIEDSLYNIKRALF